MSRTLLNYDSIPNKLPYLALKIVVIVSSALVIVELVILKTRESLIFILSVLLFDYIILQLLKKSYLDKFAKQNNLKISDYPKIKYSELPFVNKIYNTATVGRTIELHQTPMIELFDYSKSKLYFFGLRKFLVLHIALSNSVPNVIVDASANNGWLKSDMPVKYKDLTEKYTLEGNFPNYFKVYAHKEQHIEVLQILTPELMMNLINNLRYFNVECINKSVFITTKTSLITKSSFKIFIDQGIDIGIKFEQKSKKILRSPPVYEQRITKF